MDTVRLLSRESVSRGHDDFDPPQSNGSSGCPTLLQLIQAITLQSFGLRGCGTGALRERKGLGSSFESFAVVFQDRILYRLVLDDTTTPTTGDFRQG